MNHRLYLGLGILILLLIAGGTFLFYSQYQELQQLKKDTEEADKQLEENNKPKGQQVELPKDRTPPPDASPNGHWHDGVWHDEPHAPVAQDVPAKEIYTGPLTFHKELLETNPVEALRKQTEERGHWSAKWIPPFPPDDQEAAAIARDLYLITYYDSIDDTTNPICQKALQNQNVYFKVAHERIRELAARSDAFTYKDMYPPSEAYKQYKSDRARNNDLSRLSWARTSEGIIMFPERFASSTLLTK